MSNRTFPILGWSSHRDQERYKAAGIPKDVPWSFVAPHEDQAIENHDQDLERLASRGGLGPHELLAVVTGVSWWTLGKRPLDIVAVELKSLLAAHERELARMEAFNLEFNLEPLGHAGVQITVCAGDDTTALFTCRVKDQDLDAAAFEALAEACTFAAKALRAREDSDGNEEQPG